MRPLIFHEPIAAILFWASLALWSVVIESVVRVRTDAQGRPTREWTYRLIIVLLPVSLAASLDVAYHRVAPLPGAAWWPVAAGLAIMWAGVLFRLWSILTLGRFFKVTVVIQEDHRLIDRGPYRWLRHPSYLGYLVGLIGVGVAAGDWVAIAVILFGSLPAFLARIHVEERVLLNEFKAEYAAYAQRTARLIPKVF